MKSIAERRYINGRKYTKAEREAAERSVAFLAEKYEATRKFWWTLWRLQLVDPQRKWSSLFGFAYFADKITQRHTFGKYDATRPERGSTGIDYNSVCNCPTWFSQSR